MVGDGDAGDLLHHQDAPGRQRLVDHRRGDALVAVEVIEEGDAAGRFGAVVELPLERGDELLGQTLHPELTRRLDPPVDDARGHAQHGGVAVHDVLDAGPLHLHHHVFAGLEHRTVRLADRRRRERLEVERRELLLDRGAQLALDHLAHLVGGDRARRRLQLRELRGDGSGRRSLRVDAICPNFTNIPPQSSSVSRSRRANSGVASFDDDA